MVTPVPPQQYQVEEEVQEKKIGGGGESMGAADNTIVSSSSSSISSSGSSCPLPGNDAQLTIFYAGSISVFESITPEKARAIFLLAAAAASTAAPELSRSPSVVENAPVPFNPQAPQSLPPAPQPLLMLPTTPNSLCAELPLARRNSLQRFLEKRRERLVKNAPYMVDKMAEETL